MCISFDELPDEQQKIVKAIFSDPPPAIFWLSVLVLFDTLECRRQMIGEFVCVELNVHQTVRRGLFPFSGEHECLSRNAIRNLRTYLRGVGVEPNNYV
jgi:hypothetical protein